MTDTSRAPERIWVDFDPRGWPTERIIYGEMPEPYVKYIREDISDAREAAAYEAAADVLLDRGTNVEDPIAVRKDILALITDDAQTALTKMLAEARAEGMREAAALLSDNVEKRGPNEYRRGRQGYSNGIDACYAAILAAADAIRNRETGDE